MVVEVDGDVVEVVVVEDVVEAGALVAITMNSEGAIPIAENFRAVARSDSRDHQEVAKHRRNTRRVEFLWSTHLIEVIISSSMLFDDFLVFKCALGEVECSCSAALTYL